MPVRAHDQAVELFGCRARANTKSCSASQLTGRGASNPGLLVAEESPPAMRMPCSNSLEETSATVRLERAELLARGLRKEGHAADVAGRGEHALWMARAVSYDAIKCSTLICQVRTD
jgi:hypothetical protein